MTLARAGTAPRIEVGVLATHARVPTFERAELGMLAAAIDDREASVVEKP